MGRKGTSAHLSLGCRCPLPLSPLVPLHPLFVHFLFPWNILAALSLSSPAASIEAMNGSVLPSSSTSTCTSSPLSSLLFPPSVSPNASDNVHLDCPSLSSFLNFSTNIGKDKSDQTRWNAAFYFERRIGSLYLDCELGKDERRGTFERVLEILANSDQFGALRNLTLHRCGPPSVSSARLSQLFFLNILGELPAPIDWHSIGSAHLQRLNIGELSEFGCEECRNEWMVEGQPALIHHIFHNLPLQTNVFSRPSNCSFSHCPSESVKFIPNDDLKNDQLKLGSPLRLRCEFRTRNVIQNSSTIDRRIFTWPFPTEDSADWNESVRGESAELIIDQLREHHLGIVACRCWHCTTPKYNLTNIAFPTPLSVRVEGEESYGGAGDSSLLLAVRGFPQGSLQFFVRQVPQNWTEWHEFGANNSLSQSFFNESLLIRPKPNLSHFFLRFFSVSIHECSDCAHSQSGGTFELEVCRVQKNESGRNTEGLEEEVARCAETIRFQLRPRKHSIASLSDSLKIPYTGSWQSFLLPFLLSFFALLFTLSILAFGVAKRLKRKMPWLYRMKSRRMSRNTQRTDETSIPLDSLSRALSVSNYYIGSTELKLNGKIGKGAFGEVFVANWVNKKGTEREAEEGAPILLGEQKRDCGQEREAFDQKDPDQKVAVKMLRNVQKDSEVESEAALLSRLDHPNVLRIFGISRFEGQLALVLELMNRGDLRNYLHDRTPNSNGYLQFPPALVFAELLQISVQIAQGLCYLVRQKIVHRDLAARNCLVSGDSDLHCCDVLLRPQICVKISDFGMSRRLITDYYKMTDKSPMPVRWMAPESLETGKFTHQSDIWSFGVLLFEVFSYGETPFGKFDDNLVASALLEGKKPDTPKQCQEPELANLMRQCWRRNVWKRISAERALGQLTEIATKREKLRGEPENSENSLISQR